MHHRFLTPAARLPRAEAFLSCLLAGDVEVKTQFGLFSIACKMPLKVSSLPNATFSSGAFLYGHSESNRSESQKRRALHRTHLPRRQGHVIHERGKNRH